MSHNVYSKKFEEIFTIGNRQTYINNKCFVALKELMDLACDIVELRTTDKIDHENYQLIFDNLKKIQKPLLRIKEITDHEKAVFEEYLNKTKKEISKKEIKKNN